MISFADLAGRQGPERGRPDHSSTPSRGSASGRKLKFDREITGFGLTDDHGLFHARWEPEGRFGRSQAGRDRVKISPRMARGGGVRTACPLPDKNLLLTGITGIARPAATPASGGELR